MNKIKEYIKNGSKGDLDLTFSNIESLPKELTLVEGSLILCECENLTSLPDNLEVSGNLDLYKCTSLTSLPDNLKVGGVLNLGYCKSLTSIGDNLKVGGNIDLYYCKNLTSLPGTLYVKGNIYVDETFNANAYRKEVLFMKALNGEQVPTIDGEVIVK